MTWIFSSFQVTPFALTSCHIVISKQQRNQGTRVQLVCNRKGSRDENHTVRFRQSAENHRQARDTQPIRGLLTSLQGGASVGAPWFPEEDMRGSPLSEYMPHYPSLTDHRNTNPLENKM